MIFGAIGFLLRIGRQGRLPAVTPLAASKEPGTRGREWRWLSGLAAAVEPDKATARGNSCEANFCNAEFAAKAALRELGVTP